MAVKLSNAEKVGILRQVLPQFWNEAVHWREDSWRFTTWIVSSFVLIAGASVATDKGRFFAALILLALSFGGTRYLRKNYESYHDRIKLFVQVEEALLFFEDNAYIKGRSLLPKDLLQPKITTVGQNTYIFIIRITAIASLVAVTPWVSVPSWASFAIHAIQNLIK